MGGASERRMKSERRDMSGLEKIVEEIRRQAETEAADILNKADEYCGTYMNDIHKKVQEEVYKFNKKALDERTLYDEKTRSGGEFMERNALLRARQQCINEVIDTALEKITQLPTEEYFELIKKILRVNVHSAEGIMKMSKADLDRISSDFEKQVNEIATENNGTLIISKEATDIKDGFILVYGEIEENCTFKALFNTNIDKLKDIANKELFS